MLYTVSIENCFFLLVSELKLTLYVHIKYSVSSKRLCPLYSAIYLNGLRLFVYELYAMITKDDDMCQTEVF